MHYDILIKNCKVLVGKEDWSFMEHACLGLSGNRIAYVGSVEDLPPSSCEKEIDGTGFCAMPGLVNGHAHNGMTLFRGLADDLPLMTWLTEHIFPAEARLVDEEMVYWCTKLACAELLLSGTTTVADGYYCMDGACRAYDESGMRAVAAHGVIDFPAPGVPDPGLKITVVDEFIGRWLAHPRITPAVFAHSPYTCSPETLKEARQLARKHGVRFFIHVAETEGEASLLPVSDLSPMAYLESLGILDAQVTLVHGVWLSPADLDIVARCNCSIVTCPRSNMQLGAGIPPVEMMLEKNIRVGLGTDGAASNNSLDLFGEMDSCAKLAKVRSLDPEHGRAGAVLHMGTGGGAACIGLAGLGTLEQGALADIVLLDSGMVNLTPMYSPDLLVYSGQGSNVHTVIVDGKLVVEAHRLLSMDVDEIMNRVQGLAQRVKEQGELGRGNETV